MKNRDYLFPLFLALMGVLMPQSLLFAQSAETDIKIAVMAAPEMYREGATVIKVNEDGTTATLRKGTNQFVCLADDPKREGIGVSCYYNQLEPFMNRGRELRKEGKSNEDVFAIRESEVKSGKLEMPTNATMYVMSADSYNAETNQLMNAYTRWVVYIPFATEESTGLSLSPPGPGAPWLMDAGTHRAHIMITPPRK